MNTETANANPTFAIDKKAGVINFSSGVSNEIVLIEYVSDGMENGDDDSVEVNKLFEDYIYAEIKYRILNNKRVYRSILFVEPRRTGWHCLETLRYELAIYTQDDY